MGAAWTPVRKPKAQGRFVAVIGVVLLLLAGLPLAVWLDLSDLSESSLSRQAGNLDSVISSIREYYANNVVKRVKAATGKSQVLPNFESVPGAIPIPATLSLQLANVISEHQAGISYRFVSDFPFKNRTPHTLDAFERNALTALRRDPHQVIAADTRSGLSNQFRLVTPIIMGPACVACHNSHPDSPKTDWKIGDVRGIQEITIAEPFATNIWSFKYLLVYFAVSATCGLAFIQMQRQQATAIRAANRELEETNAFLGSVSLKLARYLSPQIYKGIFSGETDVNVHTTRKRLTIFFSDIKDFTATTERLQPETLTSMLNEYLTEMSRIAINHGGTVDKFIGDAILVFFGDPESRGIVEDAKACLRMAVDMQHRLGELKIKWQREGTEEPFVVRMGINTGYCNVGNFGSVDRMDYTIIGAEANLAARLQIAAEAGEIIMSYETYALVQDIVEARKLPPITAKGITREIVPYIVERLKSEEEETVVTPIEPIPGLDLRLDLSRLDPAQARQALEAALARLEKGAEPG